MIKRTRTHGQKLARMLIVKITELQYMYASTSEQHYKDKELIIHHTFTLSIYVAELCSTSTSYCQAHKKTTVLVKSFV